jgi:phospholipase/carboxylesterase
MLQVRSGGPHHGQPVRRAGAPLGAGRAVGILIHGRGATAESILDLTRVLPSDGMTWLAPQAAGHTWYPNRFVAPIESNEPWLTSALDAIGDLLVQIELAGIAGRRVLIAGFSQGACLALEFAVRAPARYGGVAGLSGGLIGPPGTVWPDRGSLEGTPVFLGCSDVDDHIPVTRVSESAAILRDRGADVVDVIYPGMGHTVNEDEMAHLQRLVAGLAA